MKMINKIYSILFIFVLLLTLTSFATASGSGVYTYWLDENNAVMTSTLKEVTQGESVIFEWNSYAMDDPVHTIVKIIDVDTGLLVSAADLGFANPIYDADHTTQVSGATTIDTSNLEGEFWVVVYAQEGTFSDDMILTLVVNEDTVPNDAPVWQDLDDVTVMLETETYTLSNLQQYVTDEDPNSLQFSVITSVGTSISGDETGANCYIQDNTNLVCSYDEIGTTEIILTVEDNIGQTASTSFNLIVEDKLDLVTMNCGDDVVLGEMLKCTAYVTNGIGVPAEEATVHFSLPNDITTIKTTCNTNDKGYCNVDFTISTGFSNNKNYTVDAYATLTNLYDSNHVTDTFHIWEKGYEINEAKIYNDSNFKFEDYDFFRGESMYTKFKISDLNGNIMTDSNLIKRVYLVVNNGEELDFDEWDNLSKVKLDDTNHAQNFWEKLFGIKDDYYYYFVDSIPLTDDFLGTGHVFWFVFDFENDLGGQTQTAVRINNNPITFSGIQNIELQETESGSITSFNIDLKEYVYDLETPDEEVVFTFNGENVIISEYGNNVFDISMIPGSEGSYNLKITADDTDGSTETQNVIITVIPYEDEPDYYNVNAVISYEDNIEYYVGDTINFDGYKSTGSDGSYNTIDKCVWNVEDVNYPNNEIEENSPKQTPLVCELTQTFEEAGTYRVSLTVFDELYSQNDSLYDTDFVTVTIQNQINPEEGPVAIIEAENRIPFARPTLIDGSKSYADEGNYLVEYQWSIFDANNTLIAKWSDDEQIIYTFDQVQSYTVELTVIDNKGNQDTAEKQIIVYSTSSYETEDTDAFARSGLALLSCEVFGTTGFGASAGEDIEIQVIVKNFADEDLEDLRMSFIIPEFGTKFTSGPIDLDDGEKASITVHGFLPYDIEPGIYYPLFTVSNDDVRRVKSGFMEVVEG